MALYPHLNDRVFGFDDLGNAFPWRSGTVGSVLPPEWDDFVATERYLVRWDDGEVSVLPADRLAPAGAGGPGPAPLRAERTSR